MSRSLMWGSSLLLAIFMMVAAPVQKASAQPGVSVSFQMFYDALSPHGQWIDDPEYGYVWSPRGVGRDFRPYYSGGYWAMTDYGNTWVSDYPWGWAPFHYGRWAYSPFYGWLWVPGNTWGPAWVHWRGGGSNYGWAPMGPGINININIGGGGYYPPNDWWTFVPCNRIYHRGGYGRYWRGAQYNNTYINNTTIINNTYVYNNNTYVTGPRRSDVERTTGQRVNVYNVRNDNNPGRARIDGRNLNVYRPDVRQDRNANARPQNVVRAERGNRNTDGLRNNSGGDVQRSGIQQNGQMQNISRQRGNGQTEVGAIQQQRDNRNREMQAAQRQQRDAQIQQERENRNREMQAVQRQQRDAQIQQERENRNREMQAAQRQQRDAQMQQERENRNREMQMQRQQRDAQMQQQRNREIAEMRQQQERNNRNQQMEAIRQQRESQSRIQQQRAVEQRAQQQQQIESRRQQRYEQPQQRTYDRSGASQRLERAQPQQQPNHNIQRGGENRGRGR